MTYTKVYLNPILIYFFLCFWSLCYGWLGFNYVLPIIASGHLRQHLGLLSGKNRKKSFESYLVDNGMDDLEYKK